MASELCGYAPDPERCLSVAGTTPWLFQPPWGWNKYRLEHMIPCAGRYPPKTIRCYSHAASQRGRTDSFSIFYFLFLIVSYLPDSLLVSVYFLLFENVFSLCSFQCYFQSLHVLVYSEHLPETRFRRLGIVLQWKHRSFLKALDSQSCRHQIIIMQAVTYIVLNQY